MEVLIAEPALVAMATRGETPPLYGARVAARFRMRVQALIAAPTEGVLFALRALDLQRTEGDEYSMRVDDEFRISLTFEDRDHVRHAIIHAMTHPTPSPSRAHS